MFRTQLVSGLLLAASLAFSATAVAEGGRGVGDPTFGLLPSQPALVLPGFGLRDEGGSYALVPLFTSPAARAAGPESRNGTFDLALVTLGLAGLAQVGRPRPNRVAPRRRGRIVLWRSALAASR